LTKDIQAMFPNSGNVSADSAKSIGTLGAAEATGAFLFNRGHSHGGSSGSPITSIPGGSLVVEYTDDNGTTSTDAVFTSAGAADFSGTVTQRSGLTSETPNAFDLFNSYSNPDGASAALPIMSMDPEGDANFIGITIQDLFTSGVAYVDNNYIFTTGSGLSPYTLDYSLFGGEGREEFGSSPALYRYYLKDHLGSTRAVWAPDVGSGQLTEATGYLPYGTQVPIITPTGDEATREKFTGKELDKDGADAGNNITGVQLSYFGKRYYDGMAGMWTSTDPDHQFMDAYAYGPNNPLNGGDKKGTYWIIEHDVTSSGNDDGKGTYQYTYFTIQTESYLTMVLSGNIYDKTKDDCAGAVLDHIFGKVPIIGAVVSDIYNIVNLCSTAKEAADLEQNDTKHFDKLNMFQLSNAHIYWFKRDAFDAVDKASEDNENAPVEYWGTKKVNEFEDRDQSTGTQ
jgi:RHS repeat-associated protein